MEVVNSLITKPSSTLLKFLSLHAWATLLCSTYLWAKK